MNISNKAKATKDLIIHSKGVLGHGQVRYHYFDSLTGKKLDTIILPSYKPNNATVLAKVVAAHCLGGDSAYAITQIEWGIGNTGMNEDDANNPDLGTQLSSGIFTPVTFEFTDKAGEIKFSSALTDDAYPDSANIWEVGLRTDPILTWTKGLMVAYFQNNAAIQKSAGRVSVGIEWLYIYTS